MMMLNKQQVESMLQNEVEDSYTVEEDEDAINKEVASINQQKKEADPRFKLPIKEFKMAGNEISKKDHIMIQDNNIFAGIDATERGKALQDLKKMVGRTDILIKQESGQDA
jgi:hypothetical protein